LYKLTLGGVGPRVVVERVVVSTAEVELSCSVDVSVAASVAGSLVADSVVSSPALCVLSSCFTPSFYVIYKFNHLRKTTN